MIDGILIPCDGSELALLGFLRSLIDETSVDRIVEDIGWYSSQSQILDSLRFALSHGQFAKGYSPTVLEAVHEYIELPAAEADAPLRAYASSILLRASVDREAELEGTSAAMLALVDSGVAMGAKACAACAQFLIWIKEHIKEELEEKALLQLACTLLWSHILALQVKQTNQCIQSDLSWERGTSAFQEFLAVNPYRRHTMLLIERIINGHDDGVIPALEGLCRILTRK